MKPLQEHFYQNPYTAYTYSYPHKTAYRHFDSPVPLENLWAQEDRSSLFLYLHIPFCEMRCGFCNLFTTVNAGDKLVTAYLETLHGQARHVRSALGDAHFSRMAIGGGTPTILSPAQLEILFEMVNKVYGIDGASIPVSVETSPRTTDPEKLQFLKDSGVDRISIGIQSFFEEETKAVGRPQTEEQIRHALDTLSAFDFSTLNIDLIYGIPGQAIETWLASLKYALSYDPEELYLYPLYTRPLTGLSRMDGADEDMRLTLYRVGRDFLLSQGYEQISMRMFRHQAAPEQSAPVYDCQEDGMVGLGCGARSYTTALHYSSEYAVGYQGVRGILEDYIRREPHSFDFAHYGFALNEDEQKRRYILKSIFRTEGLSINNYGGWFESDPLVDFSELNTLCESGLAEIQDQQFVLSPDGIELTDSIGPWFYSDAVKQLSGAYQLV